MEEPENQLYPTLMGALAEEFRAYANRGGQVFVSTHSPDFRNAIELEEACWLVKRNGRTESTAPKTIHRWPPTWPKEINWATSGKRGFSMVQIPDEGNRLSG